MAAYVKDQTDKYNALQRRKLELDDEVTMRKKKIETLESDIDELKKRLEEEVKKQKLSADRLMEELVSPTSNTEKRNGKKGG